MPDLAFYASQAELYDLAFSWDVDGEVAWLLDRFGPGTRSVLEPFCGNGRLFPGFARRGVATAGVDLSREMLAKAASRMTDAGLAAPLLAEADTRAFELGRAFDAAFCPVNSFGYLATDDDLVRHLACVARHLRPGGRYLVQLGLRDLDDFRPLAVDTTSQWDVETPRGVLRTTWKSGAFDRASLVEKQISRFEWMSGPQAGVVSEFAHAIRVRDWNAWSAALAASPFREVAAWDGDVAERPALPVGPKLQGRLLAWHELVA
jgi:SAM-dependent methyltransferase